MIDSSARFLAVLSFSAFVLVACSSDDSNSGAPKVQVKDKLGRTCTITGSSEVSGDTAPEPTGGCTGGATAC